MSYVKELAIIGLVVMEMNALIFAHIDGALLAAVAALIAGLGGFEVGKEMAVQAVCPPKQNSTT